MAIPAFGLKYKVPYTTYQGANREIRIYKDGYSATPILWKGGKTPWSLSKGDTDDVFGNLIVSGVATIEVIIEYQLEITEFLEERQSHLVQWYDLDNNKVLWSGWIEPYDGRKPYTEAPHYVTLKATCGLAQLKKIRYQHTINENPKKVALEVIRKCLFLTGHSLNINTSLFTLEVTMPAGSDPLTRYRLNTNRYLLSNGQRMYAYDILLDLMERHNCELFQENNEWIIRSIPDNARGYLSQKNYLPGGTFNLQRTPSLDYEINNDKALSLKVGSVTALRPIKRWSAKADLLPYTNPIVNGDLLEMDANGFVGWNLVPMFGQWSSFSTGKKESPNGLNINGAIYAPNIIRIKQNFWGKKTETLVEPARYVEAPPLTFNQWVTTSIIKVLYRLEVPFNRASENINLCTSVWSERSDGTDRVWLQRNGTWNHKWDVLTTKGATPELDIAPSELKLEVPTALINQRVIGTPFKAPYEIIHVRIYQALTASPNATDNQINIKIFSVGVAINEGVGLEMPTSVSYSLQTDSVVEDENNEVSLMTGEVSGAYLSGIMLRLNEDTNTTNWKRIGYTEKKTSIGSMITDRIAMTGHPLGTVQCSIKVKVGEDAVDIFQYQNYLRYVDINPDQRYKITRYSLDDLRGIITVNTIELKHADAPVVSGITRLGDSDATYDTTGDSTSIGPVIVPITDGTTNPADLQDNARINFELLPTITFTAGVPEIKDLNLLEFLFPDAEEEDIPDLSTFVVTLFGKPDFITEIEIDGLILTFDANPKASGQYSIPYLIGDPDTGESSTGSIVVIVEPNEDIIEEWPPVLDPFPVLYFEINKQSTAGFLITDYMPDLVYENLSYRIQGKPDWVSTQSVVFNQLAVTGKPTRIETRYIILEMRDALGNVHTEQLTLTVIPKTVNKHSLYDTSGAENELIGKLAGFYFLPAKFGIESVVSGYHNRYEWTLTGGGPSGAAISVSGGEDVELTDEATYGILPPLDGIASVAGQFKYTFKTFRDDTLISDELIDFTLYDEAYLDAASFELWDTSKDEVIGVIEPDGSSIFKKPVSFDIKSILAGFDFDNTDFTLFKDGEEIFTNVFPEDPAVSEATYDLFSETENPNGSGKYELIMNNKLDAAQVYQRRIAFEIQAEPVKPEPGINLITFRQNTVNYYALQSLPLVGTQIDLPENWGGEIPVPVDANGDPVEYNNMDFRVYNKTTGALVPFDVELRTGIAQSRKYLDGQEKEPVLIFGLKNSVDLGIHSAPSSFRIVANFRQDDSVVAIRQADFSFRVPLEPGDYSGLRFLNISDTTDVLDPNMPKAGGQYLFPASGKYSVSVRGFDGLMFDKIKVQHAKLIGGSYVNGHMLAADAVAIYNSETGDINETPTELSASIAGWPGAGGIRYLNDPDNVQFIIDEPAKYKSTFTGYLAGVVIGVLEAEFELIDEAPEDLPIEDCCGGGGDSPVYDDVAGTYGGPSKTLVVTATENGTLSAIEEIDIELPGVDFEDGEWDFTSAPRILSQGSDPKSAITLEQAVQIAANGNNKISVKTVATSNIALSGLQTINGYTTVAGDRVLVQNQSTPSENGPYVAASGSWSRAADSDTGNELLGAAYLVEAGDSTVVGTRWQVITPSVITVGTTPITIIKIQNAPIDNRWISAPNVASLNDAYAGGVHGWGNSTALAPSNAGTILTVVGSSTTGDGDYTPSYTNQILIDVNQEMYFRQRIFAWGTWSPIRKIWTDKHFTGFDIANWNAAYLASLNFNTLFDNRLALKTTTNLAEGTQLYFTEARVRNTPLTGLVTTNTAAVSETDSVLVAIGKLAAASVASGDRWISSPNVANLNDASNGGVKGWGNSTVNAPSAAGSILTFVGSSPTGNGDSNPTYTNQILADVNAELYFRQRIFSYGTWTPTYKLWTTKHFAQTDITNWNTAYSMRHAALTLGTANGLSLAGQVLSMGLATGSTPGALSAADWTTFNSKQAALTGTGLVKSTAGVISYVSESTFAQSVRAILVGTGLLGGGTLAANVAIAFDTAWGDARYLQASTGMTGNGTAGYLPVFTGAKVIANSIVSQSGSMLRIAGGFTTQFGNSNRKIELNSTAGSSYFNFFESDYVQGWNIEHVGTELRINRLFTGGYNFAFSFLDTGSLRINTASAAPLIVNSSALVTNFNADLLDGLHASDFARSNRAILAGTGILGGGALTANVALAFDITWGDARYALASHTHTFASLTTKPTTVAGYGITDAYTIGTMDFLLSGRVPNGRAVAIVGTSGRINSSAGYQDLSANRIWTLDLATTGVGEGVYKSVSVDVYGRITAGTNPTTLAGYGITDAYSAGGVDFLLSGRVPNSRAIAVYGTAGRINSSAGLQNLAADRSWTIDLAGSGVGAGTYNSVTVDSYGRVTAGSNTSYSYDAGYGIGLSGNTFFVGAGAGLLQDYDGLYVNFGQSAGQVAQGNDARINNGNTAYNWGYHGNFGYLTSINAGMITSALGFNPMPDNRTITINGNTQNLNNNPNFIISVGGGGTITGGGTNGYVTRWTGGSSIGNSRIIDNGFGNITFVGTGLDATNMSLSNNFYAGSGTIGGTFSATNLFAISSFTLPTKSEAGLSSAGGEGSFAYVNSGSGKGFWGNYGSDGWRLLATRVWVGNNNGGSAP